MDYIETILYQHHEAQKKTRTGEVAVFQEITEERFQLKQDAAEACCFTLRGFPKPFQLWNSVDANTVYNYEELVASSPQRNNRNLIAGRHKHTRLIVHSNILGVEVLHQH